MDGNLIQQFQALRGWAKGAIAAIVLGLTVTLLSGLKGCAINAVGDQEKLERNQAAARAAARALETRCEALEQRLAILDGFATKKDQATLASAVVELQRSMDQLRIQGHPTASNVVASSAVPADNAPASHSSVEALVAPIPSTLLPGAQSTEVDGFHVSFDRAHVADNTLIVELTIKNLLPEDRSALKFPWDSNYRVIADDGSEYRTDRVTAGNVSGSRLGSVGIDILAGMSIKATFRFVPVSSLKSIALFESTATALPFRLKNLSVSK